jgi:hypothetical protein
MTRDTNGSSVAKLLEAKVQKSGILLADRLITSFKRSGTSQMVSVGWFIICFIIVIKTNQRPPLT